MRKFLKIIIVILIVVFITIQFYQPEKNIGESTQNDIFKVEQLPADVEQIFKNACIDCHSNHTNYLWYHKIAPVSWMVNKHLTDGKKELNFSEWGEMDNYDMIGALEDIRQEVEQKTMPLKPYVIMHKKAKLSDEQVAELISWIDKKGGELVQSSNEK